MEAISGLLTAPIDALSNAAASAVGAFTVPVAGTAATGMQQGGHSSCSTIKPAPAIRPHHPLGPCLLPSSHFCILYCVF
jgi:hypothetical protein